MGAHLTPLEIASFERMVKHEYQAKGNTLRPFTRFRGNVNGATHRWDRYGEVVAHEVGAPGAEDASTAPVLTPVPVTLRDWSAKIYTSRFLAPKIAFEDKVEAAKAAAMAMRRRTDQQIINALDACTPNDTVGAGGVNLNKDKMLEAKAILDEDSVDDENRVAVIGARQLQSLLREAEATSSDYMETKPLRDGKIAKFAGFTIVVIPNMTEGGLTVNTGTRDCWFYDPQALGLAEGIGLETIISYENPRDSHLVNVRWSGEAIAIEDGASGGFVKVQCVDAAGPA